MAQVKITELTAQTDPSSSDVLPLVSVSDNETKKVTVADLLENAGDGTVSAPAFSFDNDKDTGIYRPGADQVAVSVGGSQALLVQSSGVTVPGNLTILGTTTTIETNNLVVEDKNIQLATVSTPSNTTADGGGITLKGATDKTITWVNSTGCWTFNQPTNFNDHVRIDSSGNVGIGTSSPSRPLHLQASDCRIRLTDSDAPSVSVELQNISGDGVLTTNGSSSLKFSPNNLEALRISSSGNVGIGETSAQAKLHVKEGNSGVTPNSNRDTLFLEAAGNAGLTIGTPNTNSGYVAFGDPEDENAGQIIYRHSDNSMSAFTAGAERMRITSAGQMVIGGTSALDSDKQLTLTTTSTSGGLGILSPNNGRGDIFFGDAADDNIGQIKYSHVDDSLTIRTNAADRFTIDSSGRCGIGTSSPAAKTHISNSYSAPTGGHDSNLALIVSNSGSANNYTGIGIAAGNNAASFIHFGDTDDDNVGAINYFHDTNSLTLVTAASERLRIDSSGKLLIGTTSGDGQLEVRNSNGIISRAPSTQATDSNKAYRARNNSSTDTFSVSYKGQGYFAGRVGIGTSSPSVELSLAGSDPQLCLWEGTDGASSSKVQLGTGTVQGFVNIHKGDGTRTIQLSSDGDTYFTGGNVGIGDSSPSEKLNVAGNIMLEGSDQFLYLTNVGTGNSGIYVRGNTSGSYLRSHSTGIFTWEVAGSEKMRIDSSGNLGLGLTSLPATGFNKVLRVKPASGAAGIFVESSDSAHYLGLFGGTSASDSAAVLYPSAGSLRFGTTSGVGTPGWSEKIRFDSSGRLLVGTSSSLNTAYKLQIAGETDAAANVACFRGNATGQALLALTKSRTGTIGNHAIVQDDDNIGGIQFRASDGTNYITGASIEAEVDGTPGTNDMPGRLVFSTTADGASSPTERVRIDSSGRVGIKTSSMGSLYGGGDDLVIGDGGSSDQGMTIYTGSSQQGIIAFADGFTGASQLYAGYLLYDHSTDSFRVATTGQERLRIDSSGNLGVGDSSPANTLSVLGASTAGSSSTGNVAEFAGPSNTNGFQVFVNDTNNNSGVQTKNGDALIINPHGGNVGIGTTSPVADFVVSNGGADGIELQPNIVANTNRITNYDRTGGSYSNFRLDAAQQEFLISGSEKVRIDSSGNVGIGQSNPSGKLEVNGGYVTLRSGASSFPDGISAPVIYGSTGGGSGTFDQTGNLVLQARSDAGNYSICMVTGDTPTERLRIDSSGHVGIGDTDPDALLVIKGNSDAATTPSIRLKDGTDTREAWITNSAGDLSLNVGGDDNVAHGTFKIFDSGILDYAQGASGRLRIDSSGQIGIGTSSPDELLHVANTGGGASILIETNASSGGNLLFGDNSSNTVGRIQYLHSDNSMRLHANGSERLCINSSGNVGVGESSPDQRLHVKTSSDDVVKLESTSGGNGPNLTFEHTGASPADNDVAGKITFNATNDGSELTTFADIKLIASDVSDGSEDAEFAFSTRNNGTFAERMRIGSEGKIFIGGTGDPSAVSTNDPKTRLMPGEVSVANHQSSSLHLNRTGNNGAVAKFFRDGTQVGRITVDASSTSYVTSSDYRLKENVVELADGITRVKQLAPKRFNFIVDADTTVDGFLAHEAQAVVPEAVTGERDGEEMQGIDQSKLVPLLTAALQEAIAKIETLEQRLTDAGL